MLCSIIVLVFSENALASPFIKALPGSTFFFPSVINSVTDTTPASTGFNLRETIVCKAIII